MRCIVWLIVLTSWAGTGLAQERPEGRTDSLPWFHDSFLDIRDDLTEADGEGKRVILYFHQDGCPYCAKLLRDNFGQQRIADRTRRDFEVIEVNLWGDREVVDLAGRSVSEKQFGANLRVMFTPTLLFLNATGGVVLRINGYFPPHQFLTALDFASDPEQDGRSFKDFLAERNPVPAAGRLHTEADFLVPPYRFDALGTDRRPLLVMFEQKQCQACDELHLDVLQRPESRALLARFDVAVLDMWSTEPVVTPAGLTRPIRDWAGSLGIQYAPSLVFFGTDGRELFRSEAYLRAFHVQSVLEYVATGAWRTEPEFQRYVQARADAQREQGIQVDIWK
jgi:thioredoxin-related protein